MKTQGVIFSALAACGLATRFDGSLRAQERTINSQSGVNNERSIAYRPTNTSYDIKNTFSLSTQTAAFLIHEVFNQTADTAAEFAYRVGILRLAEVYGDMTGLTTDKFFNLNSTNGTWAFENVNDREFFETRKAVWTESNVPVTTPATPPVKVAIQAELATKNVTYDGIARTPYEIKWDLNVTDFRFTHNDTSSIAVVLSVQSVQAKTLAMSDTTITGVSIGAGNGTVTWVPQVTVGGQNKTVTVTDLGAGSLLDQTGDSLGTTGETSHYLQFTIEGNNATTSFEWDPTDELNEDAIVGNSGATLTLSLAAAAAALAILVF